MLTEAASVVASGAGPKFAGGVAVAAALAAAVWGRRRGGRGPGAWETGRIVAASAVASASFSLIGLAGWELWILAIPWSVAALLGVRAIPPFVLVLLAVLTIASASDATVDGPGFDQIGTEDVGGLVLILAVGGMVLVAAVRAALLAVVPPRPLQER